ncbi:hypothetical protein [Legionella sp. 16cNR16C]|uniref:hypothetical protein n=1 Tax=Legionella sp. 16cNR16C TaxID=2905656 RepID=UPI001E3015BC|nr:hypothetical protein [Legionella sp. 16cNR16C]MCE3043665.1 hypothetical protein [Legionella sp. 16cNR16C]
MPKFIWFISLLISIFVAYCYISSPSDASAIQQAGLAGDALVWVIIPYCVARAISEIRKGDEQEVNENEDINKIVTAIENTNRVNKKHAENQKLLLVLLASNFDDPRFEVNYETVSEKIKFLKLLNEKNILTDCEFSKIRERILDQLKSKLTEQLKSQKE